VVATEYKPQLEVCLEKFVCILLDRYSLNTKKQNQERVVCYAKALASSVSVEVRVTSVLKVYFMDQQGVIEAVL
jgi:hypothetical protein